MSPDASDVPVGRFSCFVGVRLVSFWSQGASFVKDVPFCAPGCRHWALPYAVTVKVHTRISGIIAIGQTTC
ncbi:hypothetical protein TMES_15885 [Thalassospira mesophila]|uniref:Uncharacterized protein n=1 Tax=Thalassospira mesophila TaxID=1293891 RepID=A0A1Y2KX73_9PROT|nr:hypothetical protein TMES_15885 [Thalassospira mesophila]